jgi:hypothetical protein
MPQGPGILYKVKLVRPLYLQSKLDNYEDGLTRRHTNVSVLTYCQLAKVFSLAQNV